MTDVTRPVALITGASAGLGADYARELAARGHDLVLTARREDRLRELAAEVTASTGARVEILAGDLAAHGMPEVLHTFTREKGMPVSLLVNNAGFGFIGEFREQTLDEALRMVDLHCRSTVALARLFLDDMVEKKRGAILNVASTGAYQPVPYFSLYAATKAFLLSWSEGLAEELVEHGVRVIAVCPGPTATEFTEAAKIQAIAGLVPQEPSIDVVRRSLDALARGKSSMISGFFNQLGAFIVRILPRRWLNRVSAHAMRRLLVRLRDGSRG